VSVVPMEPGRFRVVIDGRNEIVYVAGPTGRRWAFWNGRVYREENVIPGPPARAARAGVAQHITAPMPATVLRVLVAPGDRVSKGDVIAIVEAMKMELPLRASASAVVGAVRCREGDLVQPDAVLVELT
jgi:biotin carboxyl carrier protein